MIFDGVVLVELAAVVGLVGVPTEVFTGVGCLSPPVFTLAGSDPLVEAAAVWGRIGGLVDGIFDYFFSSFFGSERLLRSRKSAPSVLSLGALMSSILFLTASGPGMTPKRPWPI